MFSLKENEDQRKCRAALSLKNDNASRRGAMKDDTEEVMGGAPMKDIAAYRITIAKRVC